jgi:hypothetical protein
MFECVQICTVSDTFRALRHPAAVTICPRGRSGIECRPVQRVQRPGVCVSVRGVVCLASGTACAAACCVPSFRVRWGLGSPPAGYTATAQTRPVSLSTTEKIKKTQKIIPTPITNLKNFRAKTKRPLQRVCVLCYTCLTSLEREESLK